jgi:hypothetical protein
MPIPFVISQQYLLKHLSRHTPRVFDLYKSQTIFESLPASRITFAIAQILLRY